MTVITRLLVFVALLGVLTTGCSRSSSSDSSDAATTSTSTGTGVITIVDVRKFDNNTSLLVVLENQGDTSISSLTVTVEPISASNEKLSSLSIALMDSTLSIGEDVAFIVSLEPSVNAHTEYETINYYFSWTEQKTGALVTQEL
jgi:hypothetical protein